MFDTLLRGGRIVDGTGNTWYHGAVAIQGDSLRVLRGDTSEVQAERIVDVTGKVLCPGFIDMHTHSALMALSNPRHEPKLRQGITTEVIGVDGLSYAPLSPRNLELFLLQNAGLDGHPSLDVRWSSVAEFLHVHHERTACNVAYLVPNSALRIEAVGWDNIAAGPKQLESMRTLLRQGLEEGAFGLSTGLTYPPGAYASSDELIELCKVVAELGGVYVTHVRYGSGSQPTDPFHEAVKIGRASGVPVHFSHYATAIPGAATVLLDLVDEARTSGVDVTYDSYPYTITSTMLHGALPIWMQEGGPLHLLKRLGDLSLRPRLYSELQSKHQLWEQVYISAVGTPKNRTAQGKTLAELARSRDVHPVDCLCDLLIEEELAVSFMATGGNLDNVRTIALHPAQMVCSDGLLLGDRPNPRVYGAFPRFLRWLVKDERLLSWEQAIKKLTSQPAQRLGLSDRGVIRDGMKADVVVLDPATLTDTATFEEPKSFPVGIEYVFVNGVLTLENGTHTGAHAGRALRRGS